MPVAAIPHSLAEFQVHLIGTWSNASLTDDPNGPGSEQDPLSYNVMPLPQHAPQDGQDTGYILKNSTYYETITFDGDDAVAIPTTALNRGFTTLQVPTALYYRQHVMFAQGPGAAGLGDHTVHTENGSWLHLLSGDPLIGPYTPSQLASHSDQPADITIAKQMSIPHGNSILALGSFDSIAGPLTIPDAGTPVLPVGVDTTPYTTLLDQPDDYQNPEPDLTANPRIPLQKAVDLIGPDQTIHWRVTTGFLPGGQGAVVNIPFEDRAAKVTGYSAEYWLMSSDAGTTYDRLAYTQEITLSLLLGSVHVTFPHVTSNVVTMVADGQVSR